MRVLLLAIVLAGCATTGDLRQEPMEEGVQRLFRYPAAQVSEATQVALETAGFEISEVAEVEEGLWTVVAAKGMSPMSVGELVRVLLQADGPDKTVVRIITKRRLAIITAKSDWSATLYEDMKGFLADQRVATVSRDDGHLEEGARAARPALAGWSLGLERVSPRGEFVYEANAGGGLHLSIVRPLHRNVVQTTYLGVHVYGSYIRLNSETRWYGVPATAGVAYYISGVEAGGPFVKCNAGLLYMRSTERTFPYGRADSYSLTGLMISPGIGYRVGRATLTADYNVGHYEDWFAVRLGYRFRR